MEETDTYVASQLDYKKYNYSYPIYKHSKILPLAGTQTVNVTNAGGAESLFEIPSKVFNLSKSFINFTLTPVASGAGLFNFVASDLIPHIRQIQLYTRGGLFLCDINNLDNYTKAVLKAETKLEDFLTFDKMGPAGSYGYSLRSCLTLNAVRYNNVGVADPYLEPMYWQVAVNANQAEPVLNYKINLGLIKNSILSLDHDLFFDEVVVMRIVWNSPQKYMWVGTNAANPTTAAAVYNGAVTITNLQVYVAIETNQDIVQQIRDKKNSPEGLSMLVPFIYGNKINLNGNSQSISLRYNRAHGMKLLKVYHLPVNNVESINSSYDASNIIGARISSFYTLLNNNRLQEFNVDCTTEEDYMLLRDKIKGSVLFDSNVYQYNWIWLDDFGGMTPAIDENRQPDDDNFIKGLDLSTEQKWDIYLTVVGGVNLNHYTFSVTQKMLVVGPNGIQLI